MSSLQSIFGSHWLWLKWESVGHHLSGIQLTGNFGGGVIEEDEANGKIESGGVKGNGKLHLWEYP